MKKHTYNLKALFSARSAPLVNACSAFTILELTVVIGVMALLLSISLPTIKSIRRAAERKNAAIQATMLTQAVIKYKQVYGFWPGQVKAALNDPRSQSVEIRDIFKNQSLIPVIISRFRNTSFKVQTNGAQPAYYDQNELCRALTTIDAGNQSNGSYLPNPLNPRQIAFIDLKNESIPADTCYPDPWGREFIVFMGLNPATTFRHTITFDGGRSYTIAVSNNTAFAFSLGPEGDRSTSYIFSAGVRNEN